jgi:hypothetical protein
VGPQYEIEKSYTRGPLQVKVLVSKKAITIAERLTLVIEATAGKNIEVEMPRFGEKLEQFGITDYSSPPPELVGDDKVRTCRTYTLEPFLSGEYKIPPIAIRFRDKVQPGVSGEVQTQELAIAVKSLLPSELKKLEVRDVAPPQDMPSPFGWKSAVGMAVSAFLLAGLGLFLWLRKKRAVAEAARRVPPHEKAYAELAKLLREGLVERGEIKEFYNRVSGILRHYIEDRFGLMAPEWTTEEFLAEMEGSALLEPSWKTLLSRFLAHCDLVKFAEHQPSTQDIQKTFDTCKDFIEATRERPDDSKKTEPPRHQVNES